MSRPTCNRGLKYLTVKPIGGDLCSINIYIDNELLDKTNLTGLYDPKPNVVGWPVKLFAKGSAPFYKRLIFDCEKQVTFMWRGEYDLEIHYIQDKDCYMLREKLTT